MRDQVSKGPQPGHLVAGRYKLVQLLGRGAMGEVWRARDGVLRFDVALKFLTIPREGQVVDVMERFRFEAQLAAQLGRKSNFVVAVHNVGEDDAIGPYLVMEYVRGRPLRQLMQEQGPMSPQELAPILYQVGEALSVAHELGIAHRDIKPANVLLSEQHDGRVCAKIVDFGIAKWFRQDLTADFPRITADGVVLGTPAYLSPEHACDGKASPHSDMWALAVVAYEALTGQKPFPGRNVGDVLGAILDDKRPPVSALCPQATPELDAWFARAFALDASDRFPSTEEMLAAYKAATAVQAQPQAEPAPRSKLRLAAIGFVAAAFGLVLPAAVRTQDGAPAVQRLASGGVARVAARIARAAQAGDARSASPPPADVPSGAAAERPHVPPRPLRASAPLVVAPSVQHTTRAAPARTRTADSWKSTIF